MDDKEFIKYGNKAIGGLRKGNNQVFFEAIGILKYWKQFDYVNMLMSYYYFFKKDFNRCLKVVEEIKKCNNNNLKEMLTVVYWDVKICSLAELKQYDEILHIFMDDEGIFGENSDVIMSQYAFAYAKYLSIKNGFINGGLGIWHPQGGLVENLAEDDEFKSVFFREFIRDILKIYIDNQRLLQLKSAKIDKAIYKDLKSNIVDRIQKIIDLFDQSNCEYDCYLKFSSRMLDYLTEIKRCIINEKNIKKEFIEGLYLPFKNEMLIMNIYNWLVIIDIFYHLESEDNFVKLFQGYKNDVQQFLLMQNKLAVRKILWLVKDKKIADICIDGERFGDYWVKMIDIFMPGIREDIKIFSCNEEIYNALSDDGKWAYESAIFQYENVILNGKELMDSGLMSLAFMRILEIEFNKRFIFSINRFLNKNKELKKVFEKNNEFDYLTNYNSKGLTLGGFKYFFKGVKERNKKEYITIFEILRENILSDKGIEAILSGDFEDITKQSIIDKFRNPPAHSRFLQKSRALEAKDFVECSLKKMIECAPIKK